MPSDVFVVGERRSQLRPPLRPRPESGPTSMERRLFRDQGGQESGQSQPDNHCQLGTPVNRHAGELELILKYYYHHQIYLTLFPKNELELANVVCLNNMGAIETK